MSSAGRPRFVDLLICRFCFSVKVKTYQIKPHLVELGLKAEISIVFCLFLFIAQAICQQSASNLQWPSRQSMEKYLNGSTA